MRKATLIIFMAALGLAATAAAIGVTRANAMTTHHNGEGARTDTAGWRQLMQDPAAMQVMHDLHADHVKDIQAWRDGYASDPSSSEARKAFDGLWKEHRKEMRAAFARAGIKLPAGVCTKQMMRDALSGEGMMGAGGPGMMGTDGAGMMGADGMGADGTGAMGTDGAGMMGGAGSGDLHQQHHGGDAAGNASGMMGTGGAGMMGQTY